MMTTSVLVFLMIILMECGLNIWVKTALRQNFVGSSGGQAEISAHISWLTMNDLLHGTVSNLHLKGKNCVIHGMRFEELFIENHGFTFDLPVLLKEHRLVLTNIKTTRIHTHLSQQALTEYGLLRYPQFSPEVRLLSGRMQLQGRTEVLGNKIGITLEGGLRLISSQVLRFEPKSLYIAGRPVPGSLLSLVGQQVPLDFSILTGWPLEITSVVIREGYIDLSLRNWEMEKGKPLTEENHTHN